MKQCDTMRRWIEEKLYRYVTICYRYVYTSKQSFRTYVLTFCWRNNKDPADKHWIQHLPRQTTWLECSMFPTNQQSPMSNVQHNSSQFLQSKHSINTHRFINANYMLFLYLVELSTFSSQAHKFIQVSPEIKV